MTTPVNRTTLVVHLRAVVAIVALEIRFYPKVATAADRLLAPAMLNISSRSSRLIVKTVCISSGL